MLKIPSKNRKGRRSHSYKTQLGEQGGFGYTYTARGDEIEDRREREAHPNRVLRSAYWSILGHIPQLGPGDRQGAANILTRIRRAIAQEGWKRAEWRRLYAMEKKWLRRSEGRDVRFNLFGNCGFGLNKEQQKKLKFAEIVQKMKDVADGR